MTEVSPLRKYEIERDERLKQKQIESNQKHDQILKDAQEYINKLQDERKHSIETRKKDNKSKEEHVEEDEKSPWKLVGKYIDLTKKEDEKAEKEVSRMKKILIELKNKN